MAAKRDSEIFGERLRSFRRQLGLTQERLAEMAGCARGYISSLETGSFSPSMRILRKLAAALKVEVHELLFTAGESNPDATRILNTPERPQLSVPKEPFHGPPPGGHVVVPELAGSETFAVHLPDDSMAPPFAKGDLVVFSLTRKPADGDACLIDTGRGEVLFRTALALPGGAWRLQPSNPRFEPVVIKGRKGVRMWPAIGRWQTLARRHRR